MTMALCFNCGEVKFGAICPCPRCSVASTGDMGLDIAFSDHHLSHETLEQFGRVVAAIRAAAGEPELGFWAFIRYVATRHPDLLGVELRPEARERADAVLARLDLPAVRVVPSGHPGPPPPEAEPEADAPTERPPESRRW